MDRFGPDNFSTLQITLNCVSFADSYYNQINGVATENGTHLYGGQFTLSTQLIKPNYLDTKTFHVKSTLICTKVDISIIRFNVTGFSESLFEREANSENYP